MEEEREYNVIFVLTANNRSLLKDVRQNNNDRFLSITSIIGLRLKN